MPNKEIDIKAVLNQLSAVIDSLSYSGVLDDEEEETLFAIEADLAAYVKSKGDM